MKLKILITSFLVLLIGCVSVSSLLSNDAFWWENKLGLSGDNGSDSVSICIVNSNFDMGHDAIKFDKSLSKDLSGLNFGHIDYGLVGLSEHGMACSYLASRVCDNCKIGAIRLDTAELDLFTQILDGLKAADNCGCDIVSLSYVIKQMQETAFYIVLSYPELREDLYTFLDTTDMIVVAATGNDGVADMSRLAKHPKVISALSLDIDNTLSSYSCYSYDKVSYGAWVDDGVFTADWSGDMGDNMSDYIVGFKGTSAATPIIAGAIGVIKSRGENIEEYTKEITIRDSLKVKVFNFED